jgi:predicted Zn finger-like uncharacterized protein
MDVKCERCGTEYEFDDALVSGRGTTVKCTNCGHKFKIRRGDGDYSEDFWNVTTGDGRTLVFTSLRELQRAIQGYLVERNDRLSRGGLPPKAIGHIPELAPFFDQREAAKRDLRDAKLKTQDGLGPAAALAVAPQVSPARPRQATTPEFPAPPADGSASGSVPVVVGGKSTLLGTGPATPEAAFPAADVASTPVAPPVVAEPEPVAKPPPPRVGTNTAPMRMPSGAPPQPSSSTQRVSVPPPVPPPRNPPAGSGAARLGATSIPSAPPRERPPSAPAQRSAPPVPARAVSTPPQLPAARAVSTPPQVRVLSVPPALESDSELGIAKTEVSSPLPPPRMQRSLLAEVEDREDSYDDEDEPLPPRRRSTGAFVVTVVLLGCLGVLGALYVQKNGLTLNLPGNKPPPAPTVDPRVATFIASGDKALADGNIELAKESFDKASALAEKDPHVLLGLSRLAAVRADVFWLKSRLLPADAIDELRFTREALGEQGVIAKKSAEDALAVAPDDPAAQRAKLDALRLTGDREGARALASKLGATASQPETAYVLSALDLAEAEPLWPTVIERLKTASSAESGPGRARAALIYALARSGDTAGAKAEVDRLAAMSKPHPLLALLRAYVDRSKSQAKLDAGVGDASVASAEVVDAGKPGKVAAAGGGGGGGGISGDSRDLVLQAERARGKGDYDRARTLFSAAVDKNPNDSEALSGLAAIAHAQRDLAGARSAYKRVLSINPNYMPALVGLADVDWESGDKATATKAYKEIVDRFPEGAYPARVKQRLEGGG